MRKITLLLLVTVCFSQQSCASNPPPDQDLSNNNTETKTPWFEDDFNSFDTQVWTKEVHPAGWVNQEIQVYDENHVSVGKDGDKSVLIFTAERKSDKIYSGRVNTKDKKTFCYGTLEASIKLPTTANGLWPALWLMGNKGQWPACGEIDVMEMGEHQGIEQGTYATWVNTAIHYGPDVEGHEQKYYMANVAHSLQDGHYHTYRLDWNENTLAISIDQVLFHKFDISNNLYFHNPFFVLLNFAVGGSFTGITDINQITALKDGQKANMYVDWIKIYH